MSWVVVVSEQRNDALTSRRALDYQSPPHDEFGARALVELLSGGIPPAGPGPWRQAIGGGERTVELLSVSV